MLFCGSVSILHWKYYTTACFVTFNKASRCVPQVTDTLGIADTHDEVQASNDPVVTRIYGSFEPRVTQIPEYRQQAMSEMNLFFSFLFSFSFPLLLLCQSAGYRHASYEEATIPLGKYKTMELRDHLMRTQYFLKYLPQNLMLTLRRSPGE